jgi:Chitobiase/beta-hexosaminidase C-terminal domain
MYFPSPISPSCSASPVDGTIRYTTNGTTPTCSSTAWNSPSFSSTTTLKVVQCDAAGNMSTVNTYTYTLDNTAPPVPTMTAEPAYTAGTSNTVACSTVTDA